MAESDLSRRAYYMIAVQAALSAMGGRAEVSEVYDWLKKSGRAKAEDLEIQLQSGGSRFDKEVRFARMMLARAGLLSRPARGHWELTEAGQRVSLTPELSSEVLKALNGVKAGDLNPERTYRAIVDAAKAGRFISYGELAEASGVPWNKARHAVPVLLGRLVLLAHVRGWPMLSAIVVSKDGLEQGRLAGSSLSGFIAAARSIGVDPGDDPEAFFRDQQAKVFEWSQTAPERMGVAGFKDELDEESEEVAAPTSIGSAAAGPDSASVPPQAVGLRMRVVQFHPSLSYEDFVRGWRPIDGKLELADGVFLRAIEAALLEPDRPFVLVIEEINRGNPAQIFGEMLTLLEDSKRKPQEALELAYSRPKAGGERIYIPDNLYVIGTMNVADRSLALVDLALRRRFAFVSLEPRLGEAWRKWAQETGKLGETMLDAIETRFAALNEQITNDRALGPQFRVGHSYVTPNEAVGEDGGAGWSRVVVETEIVPLLDEYWYDQPDKVRQAQVLLLQDLP